MPRCAKIQNRTRTRGTRFGNTAGIPVPVLNPNHFTLVPSIFKCELNFGLNVLPEFEVLMEFNGSLNVNLNFKYCLMPKWK